MLIICHFTPLSGPKVVNHRRRKRHDNTFLRIYSFLRRDFICDMSRDQIFLCLLASWLYQNYIRTRMFKLFGRYQSGSDTVMFSALQRRRFCLYLKLWYSKLGLHFSTVNVDQTNALVLIYCLGQKGTV